MSLVAFPYQVLAFDNSSSQHLPHTGATWKTWKQGDSRWGSITIGSGTTETMAGYGCVITSLSMGAKSYRALLAGTTSDTVTPKTVINKCKSVGAVTSSGAYVWGNTSKVLPNLTYSGKVEGLNTVSAMTNKVKEYLEKTDAEYMVMVCFNGQHYVMADYVSGGVLYVYDPAVGAVTTLETALARKSTYSLSGFFHFKYTGVMRGDVNENGNVDTTDARLILQYVDSMTLSGFNSAVADFDGDGYITETDANLTLANAADR